mmetsp:Transcript_9031/g.26582  ORF Transcript_9031/g.26582 Transcript_9031/m.26582 type:complete len:97 (+) Transcript_9031:682-972(+)
MEGEEGTSQLLSRPGILEEASHLNGALPALGQVLMRPWGPARAWHGEPGNSQPDTCATRACSGLEIMWFGVMQDNLVGDVGASSHAVAVASAVWPL